MGGPTDKSRPRQWYFKYGGCTHAELVQFLRDRTGTTIGISMKTGRARLLSRLRELDRKATFPRFMGLAPELRLRVFEHLLAPDKELRTLPETEPPRPKGKIQTAVLRTSKAIYSEAEPVLYKENRFQAVLEFFPGGPRSGGYKFNVKRPGCEKDFEDHSNRRRWAWVLKRGTMKTVSPMLLGIRRLTIKLDLGQTPDNSGAHNASMILTRLCMMMCGNSKMKELVFSTHSSDQSSSVAVSMLPQIFWPIILLPSNIVVRFEGVLGVAVSHQLEHQERESQRALLPPGTAEAMCKLVAKLRRHCEAARIDAWSNNASHLTSNDHGRWLDYEAYDEYFDTNVDPSIAHVNRLVGSLKPLAVIVDTVDIASGSTRWKMLQNLVGDAETEMFDE